MNERDHQYSITILTVVFILALLFMLLMYYSCNKIDENIIKCIDKTKNIEECKNAFKLSKH